jgi:hypothetical protein
LWAYNDPASNLSGFLKPGIIGILALVVILGWTGLRKNWIRKIR